MHPVRTAVPCALACLLAAPPLPAQIAFQAGSAQHRHANHFVPGSRQSGAGFGHALAVADFDGDGFDDLAIGIPGHDHDPGTGPVLVDSGAVIVVYGGWDGLDSGRPALFRAGTQAGARFGHALAAGDFNQDGRADLAIGAPFQVVDGVGNAGAVVELHGGANGLQGSGSLWHQNRAGISGAAQANDRFGWALATGRFRGTGYFELAIGAPGDSPTTPAGSGAVLVLRGNSGGLTTLSHQYWYQDASGVPGAGASGDEFGFALAAGDLNLDGYDELAIGVPGDPVAGQPQAGAVNLLFGSSGGLSLAGYGTGLLLLSQDHPNAFDQAEAGDRYGQALAIGKRSGACVPPNCNQALMVAAPFEADGSAERGMVQRWTSTSNGPGASTGVALAYGSAGSRLGSALAMGPLGNLSGFDTLVAGEPGLHQGRGAVRVFLHGEASISPTYYSDAFGLERQAEAGFGAAVAVGNFNGRGPYELVVAAPAWDLCVPFNPPICSPDVGLITIADDTLFADGHD